MKSLKIALGALVALVVLYLVLCLAGPAQMKLARSLEIKAPASAIYGYLFDFREWRKWSPWHEGDTTIVSAHSGNPYGVGSVHSWTSQKSGDGRQEIMEVDIPRSLTTKLSFKDWDGAFTSGFTLEETGGCQTLVKWTMEGGEQIPFFSRGATLFMNRTIGADYKKGLKKLKELSEGYMDNLPTSYRGVSIAEQEFPGRTYLGIRQRTAMGNVQQILSQGYSVLDKNLAEAGIAVEGEMGALFFEWNEESGQTDVAVVAPVAAGVSIPGFETIVMGAGKAAVADYTGKYRGSANVHFGMDDFFRDRCITHKTPVIEEYLSDPRIESDTAKWQIRIYYLYE